MMCTIDGDTIFSFMKNTWIGDSGASGHITKDDTGLYDVTNIDESIQGSIGILPAPKKGKLQSKVQQVNGTEQVYILWPVVLPQVGCKPVFPSKQTLTWRQDIK